jgi:hypothetical protein
MEQLVHCIFIDYRGHHHEFKTKFQYNKKYRMMVNNQSTLEIRNRMITKN